MIRVILDWLNLKDASCKFDLIVEYRLEFPLWPYIEVNKKALIIKLESAAAYTTCEYDNKP